MGIYERDYMKENGDKAKGSNYDPKLYRSNRENDSYSDSNSNESEKPFKLNARPWLINVLLFLIVFLVIRNINNNHSGKWNGEKRTKEIIENNNRLANELSRKNSDEEVRYSNEPKIPVAKMGNRAEYVKGDAIVLVAGKDGHYFSSGSVNGFPVVFMIDTGATYVSVSNEVASRAGVTHCRKTKFKTANGLADGCIAIVESLVFGSFIFHNVEIGINEKNEQPLLGMNVLRLLRMQQSDDRLAIYPGS